MLAGARVYYFRNVLHDFTDEQCAKLLRNTKSAMRKDSIILIDDIIVPERGAHWTVAQLDVSMMSSLASAERTYDQWVRLIDSVDMKIESSHTYVEITCDSIMRVVPR